MNPLLTEKLIIAIDGPAGSGKSTAAKALARGLAYTYLDTGALYRAMAWKMLDEQVDIHLLEDVEQCCNSLEIHLALNGEATETFVDGVDVTPFLRTPEVTRAASIISALPCVRKKLLSLQRRIGAEGGLVAEGRDIGTVVFPDAALKFFLDADVSVRGDRRNRDLKRAGMASDAETTRQALIERDREDSQRSCAPLKRANDAILIDSSLLSAEEVVALMLQRIDPMIVL